MAPRFFVGGTDAVLAAEAEFPLPEPVVRHAQVLRLAPGDTITLFDGRGGSHAATLLELGKRHAVARIGAHDTAEAEPPFRVTLAQGLAAGVPQLTMPMGFDQPDNATRLESLGVGKWVAPSRFEGDRVAGALRALLDDGRTAASCKQWADRIRARNAIEDTCDLLEQLA